MTGIYADWLDAYPIVSLEDPLAEEDWAGWQTLTAAARRPGADRRRRHLRHQPRAAAPRHRRARRPTRCWSRSTRSARSPRRWTRWRWPSAAGSLHDQPPVRARPRTPRSPTSRWRPTAARSRPAPRPGRERVAKYNQLLRIEELLDDAAAYAGRAAFPRWTAGVSRDARTRSRRRPPAGETGPGSPAGPRCSPWCSARSR